MRVTTRTTKVVSGLCMSSRRHDTTAIVCTVLRVPGTIFLRCLHYDYTIAVRQ